MHKDKTDIFICIHIWRNERLSSEKCKREREREREKIIKNQPVLLEAKQVAEREKRVGSLSLSYIRKGDVSVIVTWMTLVYKASASNHCRSKASSKQAKHHR